MKDKLPVLTGEIGDTWAYGVPSDPQKVSRLQVINRAYQRLDDATEGGIVSALANDAVLRNATRFALKLTEHTWGKDVKSNLFDNRAWKNKDFEAARSSSNLSLAGQYATLERSWWEQRHWGVTTFMETLLAAQHPFAKDILEEFEQLKPTVPDTTGHSAGHAGEVFTCGETEIGFDSTGSISHLVSQGKAFADGNHSLVQLKYRSYSAYEVESFIWKYCHSNASWLQHDYGKPGLPVDIAAKIWSPKLKTLHIKPMNPAAAQSGRNGCSFVLQTEFDPLASSDYGAAAGWTTVDVDPSTGEVAVAIKMYNKSSTRLPEAMFVQALPAVAIGRGANWTVNKLGSFIDASDVLDGGTKHLHGITRQPALRVTSPPADGDGKRRRMSVSALDAAVVNFGQLTAYPSPVLTEPDTDQFGASFLLWDNLWGTNCEPGGPLFPLPLPLAITAFLVVPQPFVVA